VTIFTEYEPAVSLKDAKAHGWEPVAGLPQPSDTPERSPDGPELEAVITVFRAFKVSQ
jgi:hypothetical protein